MASRVEFAPVPAITGTRLALCSTASLDEEVVFLEIHRRRLAGRADHHDAVRSFADVPVDEPPERIEVEPAVIVHRGHDRDQAAV